MDLVVARVFDFDDTLATSEGFIRILHHSRGRPHDTKGWLESMGISGKEGPMGSIELSTHEYAKYAHEATERVKDGSLRLQRPGHDVMGIDTDIVDYSGVAKLKNPVAISNTLAIAREAFARGEIIGIITGRSGSPSMIDITGSRIKINNRGSISRFMAQHGVPVQNEDIYCVGDMPGGVPHNKAESMRSGFLEKYNPGRIFFYDDDMRNIQTVSQVDDRITCIDARELHEGWGSASSIILSARSRRLASSSWSRAVLKSGIER